MKSDREVFEHLLRTIENNARDNEAIITNVDLWAKNWREELNGTLIDNSNMEVKNFKQFIKTTIREFLNENNQNINVTEIIKQELDRWETEYNIKTCDINTGDCFVFAEGLEGVLKMNGFKDVEVLTTDLFYELATEYAKEDEEIWYKEENYNSFKPNGFHWIENGYHGWIYVNGKHYDAEEVNGVTNFYDLPIFNRNVD